MDTPDYPGNSKKEEEAAAEKNVESVVDGTVTTHTKSRFAESVEKMWGYVTMDVILPAVKDMLSDAVAQGVDQLLFGESRGGRSARRRSSNDTGYISYNKYTPANKSRPSEDRHISERARANHQFDEIILQTRDDAESVLERLYDLVAQFSTATVSDLYSLIGEKGKYTDEMWGWKDMRGSTVRRVRSGFMLDLPNPEYLD